MGEMEDTKNKSDYNKVLSSMWERCIEQGKDY